MGQQILLVSDRLRAADVDPDWFAPVCAVRHVGQSDDGVRLRPDQLDRSPGSNEVRRAAEIAFERCPDLDRFVYAYTQNTVMSTEAYMYERWDESDEYDVNLVVRMYTGENNWREPYRYFADVHGITVETRDPDWPPEDAVLEESDERSGE
jgi:hypothetical protein